MKTIKHAIKPSIHHYPSVFHITWVFDAECVSSLFCVNSMVSNLMSKYLAGINPDEIFRELNIIFNHFDEIEITADTYNTICMWMVEQTMHEQDDLNAIWVNHFKDS